MKNITVGNLFILLVLCVVILVELIFLSRGVDKARPTRGPVIDIQTTIVK